MDQYQWASSVDRIHSSRVRIHVTGNWRVDAFSNRVFEGMGKVVLSAEKMRRIEV
jgi:hypothetical protein